MINMFKLVTGEEVVAKIVSENEENVTIDQPFVLMMAGEGRMAVVPFLPLSNKPQITLSKRNILFSYEPVQTLIDHYNQQTGGIVTAPAGILQGLDDLRK